MSARSSPRPPRDTLGRARLRTGGALGIAGASVGIGLPAAVLLDPALTSAGSTAVGSGQVELLSVLIAAGAVLLLVSLFEFRRAFAALRVRDPRFWVPSALCLVGTLGFLVLLVAAVVVSGSATSVAQCVQGSPTHALSCLRAGSSGELLAADLAVAGFALSWLGGLGIVVGLALEGRRIRSVPLSAGAAVYALALLVLVGPFASLFLAFPGAGTLLVALPFLAIAAPVLVLLGSGPR
jgi:uncharacterized membrane protein YidH (DUF202 family)